MDYLVVIWQVSSQCIDLKLNSIFANEVLLEKIVNLFFCLFSAVLINDQGEVLMMQEAKSTCAGQWYLPAGRMEPGEDIAEAAQREVLEETGLHFQITTLLMVESAGKALIFRCPA